jgi:hypothetical protein
MLYISYQGIYDGQNFEDANTPSQITKALNYGFSCMVDVWRIDNQLYVGTLAPNIPVTEKYLQGNRFWINARNQNMQDWIQTQPSNKYPNYFWFPTQQENTNVTTSGGQIITPGTVPVNNSSIIFLPEIDDRAMFSTVHLKCYGICSSFLTFIRRMRNEGIWY